MGLLGSQVLRLSLQNREWLDAKLTKHGPGSRSQPTLSQRRQDKARRSRECADATLPPLADTGTLYEVLHLSG
jgi:hypothetical protein